MTMPLRSGADGGLTIARCKHGIFAFRETDMIGRLLKTYGEWAEHEVRLLTGLIRPGDVVLDVGAHIGTLTVPLAKAVGPTGAVFAFEAQRSVFYNLATNVSLNGLENVVARNCIVSDSPGEMNLTHVAWEKQINSGDFRIGIGASDPKSFRTTRKVTLDYELSSLPYCRLVKMDIEGHVRRGKYGGKVFDRPRGAWKARLSASVARFAASGGGGVS